MTKSLAAKRAALEQINADAKPALNAFQSVRPRGPDAPSYTPPAKRGPKSTNGTGIVMNIRGQRQAPLHGRATAANAIIPRQSWHDTNDKLRRNAKASI